MFAQSGDVSILALERQAAAVDPEDTNLYSLNYDWPPFGEAYACILAQISLKATRFIRFLT